MNTDKVVEYGLLCLYLVISTSLTAFALAPFGPKSFVEQSEVRYPLSDLLILIFELGAAGTIIFNNHIFPDLDLTIVLMVITWLLLHGMWIAGTILCGRAGIHRPARRAIVLFIVPSTLVSTFGAGGYYLRCHLQSWHAGWTFLEVAVPLYIASAFLSRWVVKRNSAS